MFYLSITGNFEISIYPCTVLFEGKSVVIIEVGKKEWIVGTGLVFKTRREAVKEAIAIVNKSIMKLHKLTDTLAMELVI